MVIVKVGGREYYVKMDETGSCYGCEERFQTKIVKTTSSGCSYVEYEDAVAVAGESVLAGRVNDKERSHRAYGEFKQRLEEYFYRMQPEIMTRATGIIKKIADLKRAVDNEWGEGGELRGLKNKILDFLGVSFGYPIGSDCDKLASEIFDKIKEVRKEECLSEVQMRLDRLIKIHPLCANRLGLEELTERDASKPRVWVLRTGLGGVLRHFQAEEFLQGIAKEINVEYMLEMKHPK